MVPVFEDGDPKLTAWVEENASNAKSMSERPQKECRIIVLFEGGYAIGEVDSDGCLTADGDLFIQVYPWKEIGFLPYPKGLN